MPPLNKQPVAINFSKGVDNKTDPWQIPIGKFDSLVNRVFTKEGLLQKRNGFPNLPDAPLTPEYLTTFGGNLTAIGSTVMAYNQGTELWTQSGAIPQVALSVMPMVRNSLNQYTSDMSISANGLTCTAYLELRLPAVTISQYEVIDSHTGQVVIPQTTLTSFPQALPVYAAPKTFLMGNFFVIVYSADNGIGGFPLFYITINTTTLAVSAPVAISVDVNNTYPIVEGTVFTFAGQTKLYLTWASIAGGINVTYITDTFVLGPTVMPSLTDVGTAYSMTADAGTGAVWVSFPETSFVKAFAVAANTLTTILATTNVMSGFANLNYALTSLATGGVLTIWLSTTNDYTYDTILSNLIYTNTVNQAGVIGTQTIMARSVGLASKAFIVNGKRYMMALYLSPNQPTLFLIDDTGQVLVRMAYGNAGNYPFFGGGFPAYIIGLPSVTVINEVAYFSYLVTVTIEAANKSTGLLTGRNTSGIVGQSGINQASIDFSGKSIVSVELGANLNISGGFLWAYDGSMAQENNFFLYPDSVEATPFTTSGSMADQQYYYQVIYTWVDNQGNIFRSAPSIPVTATISGGGGNGSIVLNIPTLRLTRKTTPIKIQVYRWGGLQQAYYQITATEASPIYSDATVDSIQIRDTATNAEILGNDLIYTTGNVIENVGAPATNILTIFDDRLWLVDAEDPNLLWFSKQVIESTPGEMSDLLTYFVAPALGSEGPTGPVTALRRMDDKLIVFKKAAVEYINGSGPDNTGASSNYSQPISISSTTGCISSQSTVLTQVGLLFQSDKGIWLLGRDLSTSYIGAPVENYTQFNTQSLTQPKVVSAVVIPNTTQVRFMLDTGTTLLYDYYFNQWGIFTGITAQSSTLYQNLHTFIDQSGKIAQETPGVYADGVGVPVNASFRTGWINVAGLQGFERAYYIYLLGQYYSSHSLLIQISYDYNPTIEQTTLLTPAQVSPIPLSTSNVEQWRIFLQRQKCQAFQLTITEQDNGVGQGLSISGLNMVIGTKKGYPVRRQNLSVG